MSGARRFARLPAQGWAFLGLFAALAILRLQVVRQLDIGLTHSWSLGLGLGLFYDFTVALLPLAASMFLWAWLLVPRWVTWSLLGGLIWLVNAANLVYFRYFGGQLDWWVVQHHAGDLIEVRGALPPLAMTGPLVGSLLVLAVLVLRLWRRRRREAPGPASPAVRFAHVWGSLGLGLVFLFLLLAGSTAHPRIGTVLNDQIGFVWLKTGFGTRRVALPVARRGEIRVILEGLRDEPDPPAQVLARFRDHGRVPAAEPAPPYPLLRPLPSDPRATRALRERLGVDGERPPNLILLFLESVRDFEIQHPEIGPAVFPKLRRLLRERALHFSQTYSSAAGAGLTVRGQFSTLCSMLPNAKGAAVYVAHYKLRARCLQELARDHGYRTYWISSQDKGFNGKEFFESLHGVDTFYDYDFFRGLGLQKNFDNCGIADAPFLGAYLELLEDLHADAQPFLVNTLTITTHVPHTVLPGVELSEGIRTAVADQAYLGYLSRLRYLDDALDAFFHDFFRSPVAENTVVVLLGDHSLALEPHVDLAPHQRMELLGRVPLALVSRGLTPERIAEPVHQVDVPATLATLAGLSGTATWIGRSLLEGPGTPWLMFVSGGGLQYRVGDRACYSPVSADDMRCYDVAGVDPLFAPELRETPERPEETEFFARVIDANSSVLMRDLAAPPGFSWEEAPALASR